MPDILVVSLKTPTLSLLAQTFSRSPSALNIPYSLSPHLDAALLSVLPLSLSFPPFRFLPRLYYVASGFFPSSPCLVPVLLFLPWVHFPPLTTQLPVLLVFPPLPWESPACLGPTSAHFRFPSRDFPRQGSSPAPCDSLPHFPLLHPPRGIFPSLFRTQPVSPPSVSVPLPRSLLPSRYFPQQGSSPAA